MRISKTQKNNLLFSLALICFCALVCAAALLLRAPVSASAADNEGDYPVDSEISNIVSTAVMYTPNLSISGRSVLADYYVNSGTYSSMAWGNWVVIEYRIDGGSWVGMSQTAFTIMSSNPKGITDLLGSKTVASYCEFRARLLVQSQNMDTFSMEKQFGSYGAIARYDLVSVSTPFVQYDFLIDDVVIWWEAGINDEKYEICIVTSAGALYDTYGRGDDNFQLFNYLDKSTIYKLTGNITIQITAINDSDIYPVEKTGTLLLKVVRLAKPNLSISDGVLSWNSVQGASFYKIYYSTHTVSMGGDYFTTKTTSIDTFKLGLAPNTYSFGVSACANGVQIPVPENNSPVRLASNTSMSVSSGATYWIVQSSCTVVYGNSDYGTVNYGYGEIVDLPDPVQKGYTFEGWYTDKNCTQEFTSAFFTNDTVLYAKWKPLTFFQKVGVFFSENWGWFAAGIVVSLILFFGIRKKVKG